MTAGSIARRRRCSWPGRRSSTIWQLYACHARHRDRRRDGPVRGRLRRSSSSWFDPATDAPRALLAVTVVAGFASTIFMPLTGLLTRTPRLARRAARPRRHPRRWSPCPLHALTVRRPRPRADGTRRPAPPATPSGARSVRAAMRDRGFWILAAAFVAHGAAISTVGVHLVGYLASRGHPATFAATVAGLLGVLSVTGRLVTTGARRRCRLHHHHRRRLRHPGRRRRSPCPRSAGTRAGAVIRVIGFGLGFGVATIATPALLADRYGTTALRHHRRTTRRPCHHGQGHRAARRRGSPPRQRLPAPTRPPRPSAAHSPPLAWPPHPGVLRRHPTHPAHRCPWGPGSVYLCSQRLRPGGAIPGQPGVPQCGPVARAACETGFS